MSQTVLDEGLVKSLRQAKTKPRNFALIAKGTTALRLLVSKKPIKPAEVTEAKSAVKGTAVIKGVCQGEGGAAMVFRVVGEEPSIKMSQFREFLAEQTGVAFKPRFEVVTDLPEIDDDETEGGDGVAPTQQTSEPTDEVPQSPPVPEPETSPTGDGQPKNDGQPTNDGQPKNDGQQLDPAVVFTERLKLLKPEIDRIAGLPTPQGNMVKQIAGQAAVAAKKKDFAEANRQLDQLAQWLKPPTTPPSPPKTAPPLSNEGSTFAERLKGIKADLDKAIAAGHPSSDTLKRQASEMAMFARKQDFRSALKVLEAIERQTRQILGSSPTSPPQGPSTQPPPTQPPPDTDNEARQREEEEARQKEAEEARKREEEEARKKEAEEARQREEEEARRREEEARQKEAEEKRKREEEEARQREEEARAAEARAQIEKAIAALRSGLQATLDQAAAITPITPKFTALIEQFAKAKVDFEAAETQHDLQAATSAEVPLRKAAEALANLKGEHDALVDAKKKIEQWEKASPGSKLAEVAAYEPATPEVRAQLRPLTTLLHRFESHKKASEFVAAEGLLVELGKSVQSLIGLKDAYEKALVAKKKVDQARAAIDGPYNEAAAMSGVTKAIAALKKTFEAAATAFDAQYRNNEYDAALKLLPRVEVAARALVAAKAEHDLAAAAEIKAREKYEECKPKLVAGWDMPHAIPEAGQLWKEAKALEAAYKAKYHAAEFVQAESEAAALSAKLDDLLKLKSQCETAFALRKDLDKDEAKWKGDYDTAVAIKPVTPEIVKAIEERKALWTEYANKYNDKDYKAAKALWEQIKAVVRTLLAAGSGGNQQAYDDASADRKAAQKVYEKTQPAYQKVLSTIDPYPDFVALLKDVRDANAEYESKFAAYDFKGALAAANQLKAACRAITKKKADYKKATDAQSKKVIDEWNNNVKPNYNVVLKFQPYTPELKDGLDKLPGEFKAFADAHNTAKNYLESERLLGVLKATVDQLFGLKATHDGAINAARDDYKAAWNKVNKNYEKLIKTDQTTDDLKRLIPQIINQRADQKKAWDEKRYADAQTILTTLKATILEIEAAIRARDDAKNLAFNGYTALQTDLGKVFAFAKGVIPAIDDRIGRLADLDTDFMDAYNTDKDYVKAKQLLDQLDALVKDLLTFETAYADAEKAKDDCDKAEAKLNPALSDALNVYNQNAGHTSDDMQDAYAAFRKAWREYCDIYLEGKFLEALPHVASGSALDVAAKELAKKKVAHDLVVADKKAADDAWKALSDDYKLALKFAPFDPEMKRLLKELKTASSQHSSAVSAFQFKAAEALCLAGGALHQAVQDILARSGDQDTADTDAQAAGNEIETTKLKDLKKKTPDEKAALLTKIRNKRGGMTPEDRKLQQKIYQSLELDPQFIAEDDKKKDELAKLMREDQELREAQTQWNGPPPLSVEKRLKALEATVRKQCMLFGMDVPQVKVINDIGDENGVDSGYFSPSTGCIYINIHPNSSFDNFPETLDTIIHENAHNYQDELIRRLKDGELKPSDPEYAQATLFALNDEPGGYVDTDEEDAKDGWNSYEKQPLEEHAWKTGPDVAKAFLVPDSQAPKTV